MASQRNHRYTRLPEEDEIEETAGDLRFAYAPSSLNRIPWKSIVLALFLLSLGSVLLVLSFLVFTGHMAGDRSQAFGFLLLGFLSFLPGFYETRIAYYSWRGAKGYNFASIPAY
ncbi:transmembrane protein (DUF872) isoform X2 [Wolffia australiana]